LYRLANNLAGQNLIFRLINQRIPKSLVPFPAADENRELRWERRRPPATTNGGGGAELPPSGDTEAKGESPPRGCGCIVRGQCLLLDMVPLERSSEPVRQFRCRGHRQCRVQSYGTLKHSCILHANPSKSAPDRQFRCLTTYLY
jgi:hypothetical protein